MNTEHTTLASADEQIQAQPATEQDAPFTESETEVLEARASVGGEESVPSDAFSPPSDNVPSLKSNPAFPTVTPRSLQRPEAQLQRRAAWLGMALGVVTSILLFLLAPRGSMVAEMFNLRRFSTLIPILISALFFWGALLCWQRWRKLRELERMAARSLLLNATRRLSNAGLAPLVAELEDEQSVLSPLLRRLQAVVRQWTLKPGLQDADLVLQQHVAHDEEAVQASYSLIRTFVWALPVLGLIGTVVGISLAVGGFAQFLGGNIDDVAIVKQNLVGVTGGLSFAFLITLQGLMTSLLLMFAAATLQTREEKLYASIQQDITDQFLPVLQQAVPEAKPAFESGDLAVWRASLAQVTDGVLSAIREESKRVLEAIDERQQTHQSQVAEWRQTWRQEMDAGAASLGQAAEQMGQEFATAGDGLGERLAQVQATIETQAQAMAQQQATSNRLITEQISVLRESTRTLAGLTENTQAAIACQQALQTSLQQLNSSQLQDSFSRVATALTTQADKLQATIEALARLSRLTDQTLSAQASLQSATAQLREADFTQTLTSFRDSLTDLKPVLAGFREPFVLQAVPLPQRNDHKE